MHEDIKGLILEKIKAYDTDHDLPSHPHGRGLRRRFQGHEGMIRATWPDKEVLLMDGQKRDSWPFWGRTTRRCPTKSTGTRWPSWWIPADQERISNPKYRLCKEVIKIDHHIPVDQYGSLNWVEEERSSACEMIADFYRRLPDELTHRPPRRPPISIWAW